MNAQQIAALNAAGEALKALGLGRVRLGYLPAGELVRHDAFTLWLEDGAGLCIGEGRTAAEALEHALRLAERPLPKAA
jgi:hypothetical protein